MLALLAGRAPPSCAAARAWTAVAQCAATGRAHSRGFATEAAAQTSTTAAPEGAGGAGVGGLVAAACRTVFSVAVAGATAVVVRFRAQGVSG